MATESVSERTLAGLLSEVLADNEFWRGLGEAETAVTSSPLLARRAVDLYLTTGRFLEEDWYLDPRAPATRAVAVLREIADVAALASYARAELAEAGAAVPSRSAFEWLIRVDEIDEWAAGLGCRLVIQGGELPEDAWAQGEPSDALIAIDDLLQAWTTVSRTYKRTLATFEENAALKEGWASTVAEGGRSIEEFRAGAATVLWSMRKALPRARRTLPTDAEPIAVAGLLMAQSLFVVGFHAPGDAIPAPSRAYVSEMLRDSKALDWLAEQGAEPPEWLT